MISSWRRVSRPSRRSTSTRSSPPPDRQLLHRRESERPAVLVRARLATSRRRRSARVGHRDVLGRPLADLRHHRPDQLRPRRDGDVRSDDRVPPQRPGACTSSSPRRSRSSPAAARLRARLVGLRPAPQARRRSDLADGDHSRSVDHPQERLPVPLRWDTTGRTSTTPTRSARGRPDRDHAARPDHHDPVGDRPAGGGAHPAVHPPRQGHARGERQRRPGVGDRHRQRQGDPHASGSPAGALAALGGVFRGLDEQVAWDMGRRCCS